MSAPSNSSQQQAPSWPSLTYQTEDGVLLANKIAADLIAPIFRMGLENHALICKSALELCRDQDGLRKYESLKRAAKQKPENRSADFFTKLSGYTVNQLRNQSMRFGLEWNPAEAAKQSWGLKNLIPGQTTSAVESREYEDVISQEVLGAPIVDICIIQSGEPIPDGYFRIYKTPGNRKASLNSGNGGNSIYLCIKKDMTGQFAPVTNILVIFPDRGEYVPPGYHLVQRGKNAACNINVGTSAEHVYIAFKRDFLGNPISDLQPIFLDKGEEVPKNYNMIERTIFGAQANVNTGTGGSEIHLCYRQELMRLQCLLNDATIADQERLRLARIRAGSQDDNSSTNEESPSVASSSGSAPSSRVQSVNNHRRSRSRSPMRTRDSVGGPASRTPRLRPVSSFSGSERDTPADAEPTIDVAKNESTSDLQRTDETTDQDLEAALDSFADFYDETADAREAELVTLQRMQVVVDSFGNPAPEAKRKLLMALLVSIYTRRAEIGRNGVAALCHLLKDTDFFADDLANAPIPGSITMLDLAIETACDRFDFSPEADHVQILTFLRIVIKHSGAKLSGVSVQKLFRTINYLCNCYATKSDWIVNGHNMPCNDPSQDITPYRVLKQLVCDAVAQAETVEIAHYLPETMDFFDDESWVHDAPSQAYVDVRFIVEDIIDDIVDSVNTARICEATLQTLSKQAFSTSSVAFWQQINLSARKLFVEPALRSPFVTLCAICKQAWHNVRTNKAGEPIPRDLGSKLVALEAINEFCNSAGEKMRASKIMGYQIRRLVIPCLMFNISYALIDLKIFMKVLRILTALWNKWRRYLRIEFAILCDQFIFKTLQASVWQIRPIFQLQVIQEVIKWFEQPHLLIEMFVNYDMDRKFVSHWNTFSYLVRSLCMIGRRVSVVTNAWDWRPINQGSEDPSVRVAVTVRDVHLQALEEVGRMAKVVMDASGHAFLIIQDSNFRNRSLGAAGWVEDEETLLRKGGEHGSADGGEPPASTTGTASSAANPETTTASAASAASAATASGGGESGVEMGQSIRHRRAAHQQSEKLIKEAIKIYTEKDSLKKAVKFLVSKDFMPDTPQEVANFLRVYKNHFDPAAIGDFLGEGGTTPEEEEYYSQIRFRYTRAVPFVETDVEPALRLYLTGCGFRLPGEAQKINRFVEVFVKAFWQDNSGTPYCPFAHPDTIHMLAYAIIMLNTDLHRANIDKKSKAKKMTKEAFVNNLRGIDQGKDIDREYLSKIYDSIQANPIELAFKTSTKDQSDDLIFMQKDTMNMADDLLAQRLKATRRASGLAGGLAGGIVNPRQSTAAAAAADLRMTEEKKFIREIGQNLRDSDDLLRSLAPFSYRFQITDVDMKMSLDLVSFMFETVWFHFHSIVESIFNATSTDVSAKFAALDILCYTLTSAVFLDMKNEKMAFAKLLLQFRKSCESIPHVLTQGRTIPDDSWYTDVEQVTPDTTMEIIAKLHKLIVHIKDTIQEAVNYEQTQQVAAKFEKKTKVLDVNTFFVRQGDLQKINRNGRSTLYKFFLFSDQLIYAHLGMKKEYVAHEQLSLLAMTVTDLENDPTYCSFHVQHPTKSFTVVAESPAAKIQWIREINQAIVNCKKREQASRDGPVGRRMSMYGRIELQQSQLLAQRENERKNNTSGMMLGSPDRNGRGRRTTSYRKAHSNGSVGAAGAAVDAAPPLTVEGLAASARRHGTMASSRRSATDGGDGGEDDEGEAVFSDDDDDDGGGDDDRRRGGGGGADGDYDDDDDLDEVTSTVPFALSPPVSSSSRKRFTFDEDHGPSGGSGGSGGGARAAVPQSPPTLNTPLSLTTTGGALGNGFDFDGGNESGAASQSRARAGEDFDELSPVGQAVGGFDSGGLGGLGGLVGGGNTPVTGVSAASSSTNLAGLSSSTTATATATTTATAATPSTLPTAEERAQRQAERLQQLTTLLVDIDDKALDALFNAAASFWKTTSAGRAGSSTPAGGASSASLAAAATAAAAAAASPTATSPTSNCSGGSSGSSGDRMIALQKAAKLGPAWPALAVAIAATNAVGTDSNTNAAASAASAASSSAPTAPAAAAATGLEGNTATAVALFSVTEAQWDAWCQLGDGAQVAVDAKKAFLVEVLSAASYWKYEQFL